MADTLLGYIDKNADTYLQDFEISDSDDENVCEGRPSKSLKAMLKAFDEVPMSTAFSGIDAPGTGLCQQLSELNSRVGEGHQRNKIAKPLHLNAIEWFQPSQSELLCHPCKPHCLFGDITMFLTPFLRGLFPQLVLKQKLMEVLKPVISLPESILVLLRQNEEALQAELDWSLSRPGSRSYGQSLKVSDPQAFVKSLTVAEYDFYLKYKQNSPKGMYSLNQNPQKRGMQAKLNQDCLCAMFIRLWKPIMVTDMSTLIKSGTLWFSDYHLRWLTAAEALTCQGFPVHQKWSYNNPCCSFAMRNAGLCRVASPSRSAMIGQAGNSMHTEVSAAILSFALLEVQIDKFARQMFSTCIHIAPSLTAPGPSAPCQEERAVDGPVKQFRSSGQA
ncbi:unnamed protein product [Durusdinium trenchii]|uniref:Uncharacterized protein n=1 Tax=Durusdinium trenchii TaxID=1381693 RepID=A0ABP0P0Z3_9DINO